MSVFSVEPELGILEKEEDSDRIRPKYLSNPRGHQKTVSWLSGYALSLLKLHKGFTSAGLATFPMYFE